MQSDVKEEVNKVRDKMDELLAYPLKDIFPLADWYIAATNSILSIHDGIIKSAKKEAVLYQPVPLTEEEKARVGSHRKKSAKWAVFVTEVLK